jgi:hypothetical protein
MSECNVCKAVASVEFEELPDESDEQSEESDEPPLESDVVPDELVDVPDELDDAVESAVRLPPVVVEVLVAVAVDASEACEWCAAAWRCAKA